MDYKLAKQLKDAGFPKLQTMCTVGKFPHDEKDCNGRDEVPTLSELIDACGDDLRCLNNLSDMNRWDAIGADSLELIGEGVTPEESVAKLYLQLNKQTNA